jgi:hypothetical protein
MRAWLKILSDRHPDVTWIPINQTEPPVGEQPETVTSAAS